MQYFVALYTFLVTLIDDHAVAQLALEAYVSRGETSGEPVLEWLAECLSSAHEHFTPYAVGTIVSATLGFLTTEIFDAEPRTSCMTPWPLNFVDYRRMKSGMAEAYALFAFDKHRFPDVRAYAHIVPYVQCCTNNCLLTLPACSDAALFINFTK